MKSIRKNELYRPRMMTFLVLASIWMYGCSEPIDEGGVRGVTVRPRPGRGDGRDRGAGDSVDALRLALVAGAAHRRGRRARRLHDGPVRGELQ